MNSTEPTSSAPGTGLQAAPLLINQTQYEAYTKLWHDTVKDTSDLNSYFTEGGERLLYAYYSADAIVNLVSTPGIHKVKVRFGIIDEQFAVIAFASDVDGIPVSAYFLALNANSYELGDTQADAELLGDEVPQSLAEAWISNWTTAPDVTQSLFIVDNDGMEDYLCGYTFKAADFRDTLFGDGAVTDRIVRVHFGVHEYYRPNTTELSATFGLVLDSSGPGGDSGVFFDLSAPCPKTC
jgi:hypothetical protein